MHAATRGVEVVFHQGALPSVPRSVQDPLTTGAVNVEGTLNVLLAARDEGVRRIVFASSSSVYGNSGDCRESSPRIPIPSRLTASRSSPPSGTASASAASTPSRPSPFVTSTCSGRTKTRPPSTPPSSRGFDCDRRRPPVSIYGDGGQRRDFTYVDNVVEANLLAAEAKDANGAVLNIATGRVDQRESTRGRDRHAPRSRSRARATSREGRGRARLLGGHRSRRGSTRLGAARQSRNRIATRCGRVREPCSL